MIAADTQSIVLYCAGDCPVSDKSLSYWLFPPLSYEKTRIAAYFPILGPDSEAQGFSLGL